MITKKIGLLSCSFWLLMILFGVVSLQAGSGALGQFDFRTMNLIQQSVPYRWDTFFSYFSLIGSVEMMTLILLIIVWKKSWRGKATVFGLFFFGMAVELAMKALIFHPNPPHDFFRYSLPILPASAHVQTGHSYPSGHAYRTVFIVVLAVASLWQSVKISRRQKTLLLSMLGVFSLIMLISRVSLGEHWPSDVIGGAMWGGILGDISIRYQRK